MGLSGMQMRKKRGMLRWKSGIESSASAALRDRGVLMIEGGRVSEMVACGRQIYVSEERVWLRYIMNGAGSRWC